MRVVIADDNLLMREGIASLLRRAAIEVVGEAGDGDELLRAVAEHAPDAAIVDVRMPPTHTDEGLRAAQEIRARHPGTGIMILSQSVEAGTALQILAEQPEGLGYLLKDRVTDIEDFAGALRRVAAGGCALDPKVVSQLLASPPDRGLLDSLTSREHEVLALVAEGRSNQGAGDRLGVTERAVTKHVTSIFDKLGLAAGADDNRRILAVLTYLQTESDQRVGVPHGTRVGRAVADHRALDQPVRAVVGVEDLVRVLEPERLQIDDEVVLVGHRQPHLGDRGAGVQQRLAHRVEGLLQREAVVAGEGVDAARPARRHTTRLRDAASGR